jgi:hypothetical protein
MAAAGRGGGGQEEQVLGGFAVMDTHLLLVKLCIPLEF